MANRKFYVVWIGKHPGVYDTWDDAREQVENFPGAKYKAFSSSAEAALAFRSFEEGDSKTLGDILANARNGTNKSANHTRSQNRQPMSAQNGKDAVLFCARFFYLSLMIPIH